MWVTYDSVYRTETVKGDKLVMAVGIKPDVDSRDNHYIDRYLDCMEVTGNELRRMRTLKDY